MYSYQDVRPWLFTEEGQVALLKVRDRAFALCDQAGACVGFKAFKGVSVGDTDRMLSILDRLVELGDLVQVTGPEAWGQDAIYRRPRRS